jgi:hypothetical protein
MAQSSSTAVMDVELIGLPAVSRYPTLQQTSTAAPTIRCPMYPSDDRRNSEIIYQQTSYLFEVGTHDFPTPEENLCDLLDVAAENVDEHRYKEARIMVGRAGERVRTRMRDKSDLVFVSLINCMGLRRRNHNQLFNPVELFFSHVRDLNRGALAASHPLAVALSSLLAIDDWASAAESVCWVTFDPLRRQCSGKANDPALRWSLLNFIDNLKNPENNKKCESLLLDLAERDKQYDAEGLERVRTLTRLANCYIRQGPSQYEKAECVLEETRQLGVDPMTGQTCAESRFCRRPVSTVRRSG